VGNRKTCWVLLTAVACLVLLTGLVSAVLADNLLKNPGFEEGALIYGGTGSASGFHWNYQMLVGDNATRPESYYGGDQFPPTYNTGNEAVRFRTSSGGEGLIYQDVRVLPNSNYAASVYVRAWSNGSGFGTDPSDIAGLIVQEFDANGNWLGNTDEVGVTAANTAYQQISTSIHTSASTAKLRFMLHVRTASDWSNGAVSFDDCVLDGPPIPATLSGQVTCRGAAVAGVTVSVNGSSFVTGSNGRYTLTGLQAGPNVVKCVADGYWDKSLNVDLQPGDNTKDIQIFNKPLNNLLGNCGFEDGVVNYSGTGTGGGFNWNYEMVSGDNAIRAESYYKGDQWYAAYPHTGLEAIRFRTSYGGECKIYQDVDAVASANYTASTWVRAYSDDLGFGVSPTDIAGVWLQELDGSGNVINDLGDVASVTQANSDFDLLTYDFKTSASTMKVRFILHCNMAADYTHGAVTFDDCGLDGPAVPASLTGTVKCIDTPVAGAVVTIQGKSATTGANGVYTIDGLAAKGGVLTCTADGYWPFTEQVTLSRGANTLDLQLGPAVSTKDNLLANGDFEEGMPLYGGTGSASGNGWNYQMLSGDNALRAESYYRSVGSSPVFAPTFHSGKEAVRFRTGAGGESLVFQDALVKPGSDYRAGVWVRGYSSGAGFGSDPSDKAGLWIQEFDTNGQMIKDDGESCITTANAAYEWKSLKFHTAANAVRVRFALHSVVAEGLSNAATSFDDATLEGPAVTTTLSGVITDGALPLSGVAITAQDKAGVSGTNGGYSLAGLVARYTTLSAEKDGYWSQTLSRALLAGTDTQNIALEALPKSNVLVNPYFEDGVLNYGGTGTASGNGWNYQMTAGDNAIRAESYYLYDGAAPNFGIPAYHHGKEAIRFRTGGSGGCLIYQDADILPNTDYKASVWVKTWGNFGQTGDKAGIRLKELDSAGNELRDLGFVGITAASDSYQKISTPILHTGANAAKVRYILESFVTSDYTSAAVTYDDCILDGASPYAAKATIADLKSAGEGAAVSVTGKPVTCSFDGFFYIEEPDRSSGIKVTGAAQPADLVTVKGKLQTVDGELTLVSDPGQVSATPGATVPNPLGVGIRNTTAQPVTTGLYVRVWGSVLTSDSGSGTFTLSDGGDPIKVYGVASPGDYVVVTGALGAELSGGSPVPVVRSAAVEKVN